MRSMMSAWGFESARGLPPEFGVPDYEEEIESAFLVGSVAFIVVPVLMSIWVCRALDRSLADRGLQSDDPTP